jgi:phosphatidylglycerophosphate synthase
MNIPMLFDHYQDTWLYCPGGHHVKHLYGEEIIAFAVFIFACLTDMLDGFLGQRERK